MGVDLLFPFKIAEYCEICFVSLFTTFGLRFCVNPDDGRDEEVNWSDPGSV